MQNNVISMKFLFSKCIVIACTVWFVFLNADDICIYCIGKLTTENCDDVHKWSLAEAGSNFVIAQLL